MQIISLSKKMIILAVLVLGLLTMFLTINSSKAYAAEGDACTLSGSFLGLPTWYKYLDTELDSTGRCAPVLGNGEDCVSGTEDVECTGRKVNSALPIGLAVLEAMLRLAGMVAVVMIFVAGFRFITSDGSPDKAAGARKTVINAIIGLAIVVLSTGLVAFIGSRLS